MQADKLRTSPAATMKGIKRRLVISVFPRPTSPPVWVSRWMLANNQDRNGVEHIVRSHEVARYDTTECVIFGNLNL